MQMVESRVVERFCYYLTAGAPWGRLAFHPKANAIIEFNLWNRADTSQEFILPLRYSDDLQAKTFETFHLVRLVAGESRTEFIDIAFGSPDTFRIVLQASSVDGEALAVTHDGRRTVDSSILVPASHSRRIRACSFCPSSSVSHQKGIHSTEIDIEQNTRKIHYRGASHYRSN
jgi:hypothetical protein